MTHRRFHWLAAASATAILLLHSSRLLAQGVTTVEEEWQLDVQAPSPARSSPQVNLLIAPTGDPTGLHAVFLINERTIPVSEGGGMQLQLWNGPQLLQLGHYLRSNASLASNNERITWTTRMSVDKGNLTVQIVQGKSSTWGNFGGGSELLVSTPTSLANLDDYDPNVTTAHSGMDYGNHRVGKLVLKKIRLYTGNKKSVEQALERVVYQN